MNEERNRTNELRNISGTIKSSDPLTSFFYQLIRDELPVGKVEKIIQDILSESGQEIIFTNGWLAQYARNLADLLRGGIKSESVLEDVVRGNNVADKDLEILERQLVEKYSGLVETEESIASTFEDAKSSVEQLRITGSLSAEEAKRIMEEIDQAESEQTIPTQALLAPENEIEVEEECDTEACCIEKIRLKDND